jgi:hypothetical protein
MDVRNAYRQETAGYIYDCASYAGMLAVATLPKTNMQQNILKKQDILL